MSIHLHIERLVLDGFAMDRGGQASLQAAVETELPRLLMASGLGEAYAAGGSFDLVRGGSIHLDPPGPQSDSQGVAPGLGQQIASALSASLGAVK